MTAPTADEIRNEPASCRLDAWVAEFVMGWNVSLFDEDAETIYYKGGYIVYPHTHFGVPWTPSEDIAAAMQVLEKAMEDRYLYVAMFYDSVTWEVEISDGEGKVIKGGSSLLEPIINPSLELAICRAALLAALERPA